MIKPDKAAPRVPAGSKSLAAAAARTRSEQSDADLANSIEGAIQGFANAQTAIAAAISFGESLCDAEDDWHIHRIRSEATLATRLAYVAGDQVRGSMLAIEDVRDSLFDKSAPHVSGVPAAFEAWLACKTEQLTASGLDADADTALDAAELAAFNSLAAAPAASANDVVLKLFALATLECDDGMAHPGRTSALDLAPPPGLGYVSTIWRGLLADLPRVSGAVCEALLIPSTIPPVRRAA